MVYDAPEPHECRLPERDISRGSIWRCDCGQHWTYKLRWPGTPWAEWLPISPKDVAKILKNLPPEATK